MTPKVITGARAKFSKYDPITGRVTLLGTVSSVSFSVVYDVQAAHILGRYSAAALEYTAVEPVTLNCQGWRVFGHGAHTELSIPHVQDLLLAETIQLTVTDRVEEARGNADPRIYTIRDIRPAGYSAGFGVKALSEMGTTYVGLLVEDESGTNAEHVTAADLP